MNIRDKAKFKAWQDAVQKAVLNYAKKSTTGNAITFFEEHQTLAKLFNKFEGQLSEAEKKAYLELVYSVVNLFALHYLGSNSQGKRKEEKGDNNEL
jgi:hypothetical protein